MALSNDDLQAIATLIQGVVKTEIEPLQTKLEALDKKLNSIETSVTDTKLTLENVTNHNIKIIAEGHIDLNRKLNEVIHTTSDIKAYHELQNILINEHESKIKQII